MSAPDTTSERVLQAVRAWAMLAASRTPLTDAQVIPADAPGPRPAKPYLVVKVTAPDLLVGVDEPVAWLGDLITVSAAPAGTVYEVTARGEEVSYTSTEEDDAESVAAALAEALCALDLVFAEASGDALQLASLSGELGTEVSADLELEAATQPVAGVLCLRRATVSIQGFGAETAGWLERMVQRLPAPDVAALLEEAGLSVEPVGGITNVALLIDTGTEPRYARDVEVAYGLRGDPWFEIPAALSSATVELVRREDDPDPYTLDVEAELE